MRAVPDVGGVSVDRMDNRKELLTSFDNVRRDVDARDTRGHDGDSGAATDHRHCPVIPINCPPQSRRQTKSIVRKICQIFYIFQMLYLIN